MKRRFLQQKAGAEKQARRSLCGAGVNVKAWKDLEPLEDGVYHVGLWHNSGVVGRGCCLHGLDGSRGGGRHPPLFFSTVLAQRTKATPAAEGIPA